MAEARVIPIKSEPAKGTGEQPASERRSTTSRKPADQTTPATNGSAPAPSATPKRAPSRRTRVAKDPQPAQGTAEGSGVEPDSGTEQPTATTRKRRATARKPGAVTSRRRASTPEEPSAAEHAESPVRPPEELHDLGTFVTRPEPSTRDEPIEPIEPDEPTDAGEAIEADQPEEPAAAQVWPNPAANGTAPERPAKASGDDAPVDPWERKVAGALSFVRRRLTGEYEIDEFGFDPELATTVLAAPLRPLYEKWFRVEVSGMENVPAAGGALIVANHSGVIALDGVITALALLDHHPARRHLRMLGADLVFKTPFLGEFARKAGNTLACNADAERLLSSGELVGVYPEGFKGVGKPFSERYKLQRFGRGGFVSAALRTKAPIIPCSIVGAEEIYPLLGNAKILARLLGLPYFPITPTFPWLGPLGMIPLPSKWYIEFGEPIETESLADRADDPMLVFNVADQVRETIQQTLYRLLMKRKSVFG